jgi:hypothetical protein
MRLRGACTFEKTRSLTQAQVDVDVEVFELNNSGSLNEGIRLGVHRYDECGQGWAIVTGHEKAVQRASCVSGPNCDGSDHRQTFII